MGAPPHGAPPLAAAFPPPMPVSPSKPPACRMPWAAVVFATFLVTAPVLAQPSRGLTPYVQVHLSAGSVEGDVSRTLEDPGIGRGGEAGLVLSDRLSVGAAFWRQTLPSITETVPLNGRRNTQGTGASQFLALVRYRPWTTPFQVGPGQVSPFLTVGGAIVTGQGTSDERNEVSERRTVPGYGPVLGGGFGVSLSPTIRLVLESQSTVVFPDVTVDGADLSAFRNEPDPPSGAFSDSVPFDVITNVAVGLRYTMASKSRAPRPPARLDDLTCPAQLEVGERGAFAAAARDAESVGWDWGDGAASEGPVAGRISRTRSPATTTS